MKRAFDANDHDSEKAETPTSPKRYITLQSFNGLEGERGESAENDFSNSRDPGETSSKMAASSSCEAMMACTGNEVLTGITGDAIIISPSSYQSGELGFVVDKDSLSPAVEPIPAEYGAEELVLPVSTPELSTGGVEPASKTKDTQGNATDTALQRTYTPLKTSSSTAQPMPVKFISLRPKQDKKTIIVHKPVKSNVGELGSPIVPPKKTLEVDCCIIQTLMKKQFTQKSWTDRERITIIGNGPPQPDIARISIGPSEYKKFPWLAGCTDANKMYCWYCLLFSSMGVWSTGVFNRGLFNQVANKHNATSIHIEAQMLLRHWNAKISSGLFRGLRDSTETAGTGSGIPAKNQSLPDISPEIEQKNPTSKKASGCVIVRLLANNFVQGGWTEKERENIIEKGRPIPKLESLMLAHPVKHLPYVKHLSGIQYKKVPWLTGSEELNKLFCWPCVLFCSQGAWAKTGYANLNLLTLGIHRHEISQQHLEACLRLKVWEQQIKRKTDIQKVPLEQHNEAVRRSRDFMTYVIDVICYFKKKTENTNVSYADFLKVITKISRHDAKLKHYLRTRSFFEDEISSITKSIYARLIQRIFNEANKANFVSVMMNGVPKKPWLSVVLRYVKDDGEVHERFLQFIEFKYDAPINDLLEKVHDAIGFLNIKAKLIGFTHDDSVIKPTDLAYFSSRVTEKYRSANFFHYGDHNLKTLLQQSLAQMSHCRNFIHGIHDLVTFFERNPIAKTSLTIIDQEISGEDVNWDYVWNFTSGIIKTINDHYPAMMKLFERMIRSAVAWNTETVAEAHNFITFLSPLDNRFLIATFSRILDDIDELTKTLEMGFSVDDWKRIAEKTSEAVIKTRCDDFEMIFQSAWNMLPSDQDYVYDLTYAEKFDEIMESASLFIHCRTKDLDKWSYIELVTNPTIDEPSKSSQFNKHVDVLKQNFPQSGFEKLSTQLSFFKGNALFKGKTVDELIKYIYDLDMIHALPSLHKFSQLLLTAPLYPISTSKPPAIKRIASYINNRKDFTSTDALMYVEKDLLAEMQKEPDFHEDVITHFVDNFGGEHLKFRKSTEEETQ